MGFAAIAIPIVLHLTARREPKKVVFPAVRFLAQRYSSNRSKLNVKRWWLLAMRIAAIAALAAALARPVISQSVSLSWISIGVIGLLAVGLLALASVALTKDGSKNLVYSLAAAGVVALLVALLWSGITLASGKAPKIDQSEPVAICLLLDNSPTTAWSTADDVRADRLREIATRVVSLLPPTSRIAVIDRSTGPAIFSLDPTGALSKIDQLQPREFAVPIRGRIDAAARLLRTSELESKQILIVSDFANSTWKNVASEQSLAETFGTEPTISVALFDLGELDGTNRSLENLQFESNPAAGTAVSVAADIKVTATDRTDPVSATVELMLYDNDPTLPVVRNDSVVRPPLKSVDRKSVQVIPGSSASVNLRMPPLGVGIHHGVVALVGDDGLPLDDRRFLTINVEPAPTVLIVGDDADDLKNLNSAIRALLVPNETDPSLLIQSVSLADLSLVPLTDFDAVVLSDPDAGVFNNEDLSEYVAQGGGILIFLGPSAGLGAVDCQFGADLIRPWRIQEPGTFFEPISLGHPVFQAFNDVANQVRWSDFRIHQYWKLNPKSGASVLARFAVTDHPAIIDQTIQDGHVILFATPMPAQGETTDAWNDLFGSNAWPAFMLLKQSLKHLIGQDAGTSNTSLGRPHLVNFPVAQSSNSSDGSIGDLDSSPPIDSSETDSKTFGSQRWQLYPPGDRTPAPVSVNAANPKVSITDVTTSGTYLMRHLTRGVGFSANLPDEATETSRFDLARLDEIFGIDGYKISSSFEEIDFGSGAAKAAVSLRSPALLLALVVFLLEQVLSNRFYGSGQGSRSRSDAATGGSGK